MDIYDYILNGKLSGNIKLSSGDIIIVNPYECLVNITGKIKRPMFYEMKKNESVATLLKYAGGFAGDAYTKNLRLVRKAGGVKSVYTIDEFERTSFQLMDEDVYKRQVIGISQISALFEISEINDREIVE